MSTVDWPSPFADRLCTRRTARTRFAKDPTMPEQIALNDGSAIPQLGLGVCGRSTKDTTAEAVVLGDRGRLSPDRYRRGLPE
jgi:hypothetical protein